MGAHVKSVGNERNRSKQPATDNSATIIALHRPNYRPGLPLAFLVVLRKEHMAVNGWKGRATDLAHGAILVRYFRYVRTTSIRSAAPLAFSGFRSCAGSTT